MVWGSDSRGGDERKAPTGTGYNGIYATYSAFVAIKENGALFAWGMGNSGVIGAPTDSGYVTVHATANAFAAMKLNGTLATWGTYDL